MDAIIEFIRDVGAMIPTIRPMDFVDILLVALLIYAGINMVRSTAAARVFKSVVLILAVYLVTDIFKMYLMNFILEQAYAGEAGRQIHQRGSAHQGRAEAH